MSDATAGRSRDTRVALAIVTSAFSAMLLSANLATPLYAVWASQTAPTQERERERAGRA